MIEKYALRHVLPLPCLVFFYSVNCVLFLFLSLVVFPCSASADCPRYHFAFGLLITSPLPGAAERKQAPHKEEEIRAVHKLRKVHYLQVWPAPEGLILPRLRLPQRRLRYVREAGPGHNRL